MGDNERVSLSVSKEAWQNFTEYVGANCFSTQLPPAVKHLIAELVLIAARSKDQAMRAGV
jgi:hypothetical protein